MKKTLSAARLSVLLMPLVLLGPLSMDMYLPALTNVQESLHMSSNELQWTLSIFVLGFGLSQLLVACFVNFLGALRTLLMGLLFYALSSLLLSFIDNISLFIALRFFQAFFSCIILVISMGLVRKVLSSPSELESTYSILAGSTALAPICSPVLGALLMSYFHSWRVCFLCIVLFSVVGLINIILLTHHHAFEREKTSSINVLLMKYITVLKHASFWQYAYIGGSAMSILFCYFSMAPSIYMGMFHLNQMQFSYVFGFGALGFLMSSLQVTKVLKHWSFSSFLRMLLPVLVTVAWLISGPIAMLQSFKGLLLAVFIINICIGFIMGPAMSAAMLPFSKMADEAASIYGFIQFVFAFSVSTLFLMHYPKDISHLGFFIVSISAGMLFVLVLPRLRFIRSARS